MDRAEIDVSLAGSRLHLHRKVRAGTSRQALTQCREIPALQHCLAVGGVDVVPFLNGTAVIAHLQLGKGELIAQAAFCLDHSAERPSDRGLTHDGELSLTLRLAIEKVHDGVHCVELVLLARVKLNLQRGLLSVELDGLEASYAGGLEVEAGVFLELVVPAEGFVEEDDLEGLTGSDSGDGGLGDLLRDADDHVILLHGEGFDAGGVKTHDGGCEWKLALEKDLVEQVFGGPAL